MPVRPKDRFDVFKSDGFQCQYCGRKVPDVVLEVDHIIPVAKGGGDEIENLTTSCWDCNRGKRDALLDERAPVKDMAAHTELIRERERQLEEYNAVKATELARKQRDFNTVWNYWFEIWDAETLEKWYCPWENALKSAVERLGTAEVMEAMDITRAKFSWIKADAVRYFGGIVKRKIAKLEGRVVPCSTCGKDVLLEPGDDLTASWRHAGCKEPRG